MSYKQLDESTLTPQELAGKREFDEIDLRYLPLMDAAQYDYESVVSDRDHAEDEPLEKSLNARAYVKRILAHHAENQAYEQTYKAAEVALETMRSAQTERTAGFVGTCTIYRTSGTGVRSA